MGFVQVDSINVVARAHHLTLASRLDGYRPELLDRLLERDRMLFEHWTRDAAAVPTAWYPHWRYRFVRARQVIFGNAWWMQRLGGDPEGVSAVVLDRIRREGPLMARDFERPKDAGRSAWWGWTREKAALEFLWHTGALLIARREQFHKVYDLAERVLPAASAGPASSAAEYWDWACRAALARLGTASPEELTGFWRTGGDKRDEAANESEQPAGARAWCQAALARGEIVPVEVESVDGARPRRAYAFADWRERAAAAPAAPRRLRLLCPFDPIVHDRRRTRRLFGFDYTIECFVPAAKRRYGYYVLPILEGERLVGRLDPKLHRDRSLLAVRKVWWEPGVKPIRGRRAGLEAATARLARLVGAERWTLPRV
jgi:uncharacterized protein